ncbi:MAG: ANTAR domain-containing response regulator [Anaerocolumna sp.]
MPSIIIAFPKLEDATSIKNALIRNGFEVNATCTTGAQVVSIANELDDGFIICGYRFSDMHYSQLNTYLPIGFEMLLIASATRLEECTNNNIVCLSMPIKMNDLLNTLQMMFQNYNRRKKKAKEKPKPRSDADKETITKAKLVLMDRNNMTEEEAHRYIQKNSMDSGTNMVEMAHMILSLM